MNILHLTDFHINRENRTKIDELYQNIGDAIKNLDKECYPDTILVTGDLTETGNQDEYKWFKEGFKKMLEVEPFNKVKHIMLVPGNHDFSWQVEETRDESFRYLCEDIEKGLSSMQQPEQDKADKNLVKHVFVKGSNKNVLLIGMNSMKIDSQKAPGIGYFSKEQLRIVEGIIDFYKTDNSKRLQVIVAFHHHLGPVTVLERDTLKNPEKYSITIDARRAINTFLDKSVDFAVHGHQHQPSMVTWKDDERKDNKVLHIISAGCLAGKLYAGEGARNSFMLYSIKDDKVVVNKAESANNDSDIYMWSLVEYPDIYEVDCEQKRGISEVKTEYIQDDKGLKSINKKRILALAEQDDQWINRAEQIGALTIRGLVEKLVDSIADDGSVAYEANIKGRYRTSTLATVLECMNDIRLLPEEDLKIMQKKLLSLKDVFVPMEDTDDVISKNKEDQPAWGIDESPSVWTTSKALLALFTTKYEPNSEEEKSISESVIWLANQAYDDGGWGYQKCAKIPSCCPNVPMTALAMKTLGLALQQDFVIKRINERQMGDKLIAGLEYLKRNKIEITNKKCVWQYEGEDNLSVTVWALEAWKIASDVLKVRYNKPYYSKIYRKIKPITLKYVVESLPEEAEDNNWTECFFRAKKEHGLKYKPAPLKRDKVFYSFTPYIISYIIREDETYIDNPKILSVIKWVLAHRDDVWLIPTNYNSNNACTISVAMAINVIVNWLKVRTNSLMEKDLDELFL